MPKSIEPSLSPGVRIQNARKRAGMSRAVLGGLVDRSAEWVKAVETGRLHTPRLDMLLRIAQALGLEDLRDLTGTASIPVASFGGEAHAALADVRTALTSYHVIDESPPASLDHLAVRLQQAWHVRHSSPDHRTRLGVLLPGLIRDAQHAVRRIPDGRRRAARRVLAGVYQLADFYVAYQPAPELLWIVADRALIEGQEADDPYTRAGGVWAMVQALRDAGRWEEAIELASNTISQLNSSSERGPDDWRGMVGALEAELAYIHARRGRAGDAWAHLETAHRIAGKLGGDYRHIQTSYSQAVMTAHATTVAVELRRAGEAVQAASRVSPDLITSVPRRARHLIEIARAHHQQGDYHATFALLDKSFTTAPETIRYNGFGRAMILDMLASPPTGLRAEVQRLASNVGLAVAA
ncbi:helix-turn-helix domain-containing protein [Actinokineospora enzanensis]|uniref:helix-turn-helix domain-containing protein n=1 Tax=Actinokineospora enzanensis TaxID=155975 RepID=UPI0004777720|nr:helix-turn-helix transcriptional regulator [Actinokineospora enzanensis]